MKEYRKTYRADLLVWIEVIDECINKGLTEKQIYRSLCSSFSCLKYDTLRQVFSEYTHISLGRYIRRRRLTIAYLQYKQEKPCLKTRSRYFGINNYKIKFENEFGPINRDYSESELQAKIDLQQLYLEADTNDEQTRYQQLLKLLNLEVFVFRKEYLPDVKATSSETRPFLMNLYEMRSNLKSYDATEYLINRETYYKTWKYYINLNTEGLFDHVICAPKIPKWAESIIIQHCDEMLSLAYVPLPLKKMNIDKLLDLRMALDTCSAQKVADAFNVPLESMQQNLYRCFETGILRITLD